MGMCRRSSVPGWAMGLGTQGDLPIWIQKLSKILSASRVWTRIQTRIPPDLLTLQKQKPRLRWRSTGKAGRVGGSSQAPTPAQSARASLEATQERPG